MERARITYQPKGLKVQIELYPQRLANREGCAAILDETEKVVYSSSGALLELHRNVLDRLKGRSDLRAIVSQDSLICGGVTPDIPQINS